MTDEELDNLLDSLSEDELAEIEQQIHTLDTDPATTNPGGLSDEKYLKTLMLKKAKREKPPQSIRISSKDGGTKESRVARYALMPEVNTALNVYETIKGEFCVETVEIYELIDELNHQTELVKQKDLSRAESMLAAQAHTLDQLFNKLMHLGVANMGEYLNATETFIKLAMRAQSQCRSTWEAISDIQNPPVQYVKQLNMANNQQVNNDPPHTREIENQQTKLSEVENELCENAGTPGIEKKDDSPLEALGEVHRAKISRR